MEDWNNKVDQIVALISSEQLTKLLQIGQKLKKSLSLHITQQVQVIEEAKDNLFEYFDTESCQVFLQIIGNNYLSVDKNKNQIDTNKLDSFLMAVEDRLIKNSGMFEYTDSLKKGALSLNWTNNEENKKNQVKF